ncbi:putative pentatricopeptide repeat-containing protein At5g52630 [Silene latifolia]|uniref:putative pentatricopeptide repeat-containing protein At5g52630 n=1 Tax=Silene latifolia TaxID=37657 RepID=UPI003D76E27B
MKYYQSQWGLSYAILQDPEAVARLLRTYSQTRHLSAVKHFHAQLLRSLRHVGNYVNNHLLLSYEKCGCLDYAQKLFDNMPQRNLVSWTAMITAFSRRCLLANAVAAFSEMRHVGERPNEFAFSSVIQAATRDVGFGRQVHCLALKSGFGNELFVGSNLADMYSKSACIHDACKIFEEMPYKDHVSWTSMIDGYAKHGYFKNALSGFKRMLLDGVVIDSYVLSSAISASASMKACTFGRCVHCFTLKLGFEEETAVGNALVDMYSKVNDMESAARVFRGVSSRMNVVSYTSLIDGYVESDQIEKALDTFVELTRKGMVPNEFTFSSLVKACANQAALEQGLQLHAQVVKMNFVADPIVSSALVYMYGKCGLIDFSAQLFHCIVNPSDYAWNSLMSGFSHNGLGKEVVKTFETMIQRCIKPNAITFVNLIMGCSHAGLVEAGLNYFNSMESRYGVAPSAEHYSCVIDLLSRAGKLREADDFINRMPFEPDCFGWCSYLNACRIQGDKARAEFAAEKLMRLEPENSSAHVMLSSIYAKERQWEDVRSLRKMMKDGNLKKLPGYSWVDVGNKTHVFGAHDWSHPQQVQIYKKLDSLIDEIKRMGYKPERDVIHIDTDDSTKEKMLQYHSEKIAVAFAVMSLPSWKPIIIKKNLRICIDCHSAIKLMAKAVGRSIIVRDNSRFHHFADGYCSCNDFW